MTLNRSRIARFATAFVAVFAGSQAARAAQVVYDGFDYPTGKLSANNNTNPTAPADSNGFTNTNVWTKSGTAADDPDVVTGNLAYPGLPTSGGNMVELTGNGTSGQTADRIATQDFQAGDTIYFSMLVQVPSGVTNYGGASTA